MGGDNHFPITLDLSPKSGENEMKIFLLFALLFSLLLKSPNAFSDYTTAVAKCMVHENKELVRFGVAAPGEPFIPYPMATSLIKKFKKKPYEKVNDCTLANGQRLEVKFSLGTILYKENGGDPNAYVSVSLNEKNIYNKVLIYRGYGSTKILYSGILFCFGKVKMVKSTRPSVRYGTKGIIIP